MKKAIALFLALTMMVGLTACGSSSTTTETVGSVETETADTPAETEAAEANLEYPVRSINNIIPFGAGGGTDLWNRAVMESMSTIMGQTIVSSNMTGGSAGSVGVSYVWEQGHDGYSLCGTSETPLTIPVMTGLEQTTDDWIYFIAAGSPGVLCVNKNCEYADLDSVVSELQANPESLSIAGTTGGLWFALAKLFDSYGNTPFKWVSYDGSSSAIKGCVSNETNAVVASAGEVVDYVRSGDLIPLCVMDTAAWEFPDYGEIPAVTDALPDLSTYLPLNQFLGFMVPADTDEAIVSYLEDVFHQAMATDTIKTFAEDNVCTIYDMTGEEASAFAKDLESKLCWVLYDMGQTTYSPEDFGIAKP